MDVSAPSTAVRRLGVLGGSFDPVHFAHLLAAESACEALDLDLVLFLPARKQPLKAGRPAASAQHRVEMLRLAIQGNPRFSLSTVDLDRPGPSYTVDTLRQLRDDWGGEGVRLWFIVGADSLATFPTWRDPQGIIEQARLAVVRRPGVEVDTGDLFASVPGLEGCLDWIDSPLMQISATEIRERVARGQSIRYRVPEPVREYILANGLYR